MGTKNEKTIARSEETETQSDNLSRRDGVVGRESENPGNQQKRDNRASSTESSIFSAGTTVTGGMLDHLIEEYCEQVISKQNEITRLSDEINRLNSRVQEFRALREELKKQSQNE